jgi:hypothetical protein
MESARGVALARALHGAGDGMGARATKSGAEKTQRLPNVVTTAWLACGTLRGRVRRACAEPQLLRGLRCRRRARTGVALLRLRRRLLARVNRRPVSAQRQVAPRAHASVALGEPPKHVRQPLPRVGQRVRRVKQSLTREACEAITNA